MYMIVHVDVTLADVGDANIIFIERSRKVVGWVVCQLQVDIYEARVSICHIPQALALSHGFAAGSGPEPNAETCKLERLSLQVSSGIGTSSSRVLIIQSCRSPNKAFVRKPWCRKMRR